MRKVESKDSNHGELMQALKMHPITRTFVALLGSFFLLMCALLILVQIQYNIFSIIFLGALFFSSLLLLYWAFTGIIHPRYTKWVKSLISS